MAAFGELIQRSPVPSKKQARSGPAAICGPNWGTAQRTMTWTSRRRGQSGSRRQCGGRGHCGHRRQHGHRGHCGHRRQHGHRGHCGHRRQHGHQGHCGHRGQHGGPRTARVPEASRATVTLRASETYRETPSSLAAPPPPPPCISHILAFGAHPRAPARVGCIARGVRGEGDPGPAAGAAAQEVGGYGSGPLSRGAFRIVDAALCDKAPGATDHSHLAIVGCLFDAAVATHTSQIERREDAQPAAPQRAQAPCTLGTRRQRHHRRHVLHATRV